MITPDQITQIRAASGLQPLQSDGTPPAPKAGSFLDSIKYQPTTPTDASQNQSQSQQPGFFSRVGSDLKNVGQNIATNFKNSFSKNDPSKGLLQNTLDSVGQAAHGGIKIARNLAQGVNDVTGEAIQSVAPGIPQGIQKIADTPWGQGVAQRYQDYVKQNPGQAEALGTIFDIGSAATTIGGGIEGVNKLVDVAPGIGKDLAQTGSDIAGKVKSAIPGAGPTTPEDLLKSATRQVTPDYESATATQKVNMQNQTVNTPEGSQPRVVEGKNIGMGVKGNRVVNLTSTEQAAAQELSKVPGYNPNATNLETHNLIKSEIAKTSQTLDKYAGQEIIKLDKSIPKTVESALSKTSDESLLLQKEDPTISNYMRVVRNASATAEPTVKGILDVRRAMDAAYENARGKLAYGSDKMSALDEVHTAARDSLNELATKNAKNVDVKAALEKQTNLYRADDVINKKAATEGNTSIERTENKLKSSPVAKTVSKLPVVGKYLK